jgi:DNA transformation protein
MRAVHRDTAFIEHLRELIAPLAAFDARRMFGGWGVYLDGRMCALVADGQLYLKTDAATRAAFEAAGCAPFVYTGQKQPITMSYWSVPDDALDSSEAMAPWARRAMQAADRAPPTRRPAARQRPTKG